MILLCATLQGMAQETPTATEPATPASEAHIGTMWDLSLTKNFGIVSTTLQQSVFTIDTSLERAMSILVVNTQLVPTYLNLNVLGFYLYYRMSENNYNHLLRYHLGLSGAAPMGKPLTFTWSSRFESTYIVGGNGIPINKFRARVRFVGNIPQSKFQPFLGSELFLKLNNPNAGHAERVWIDAGVTYNIDKNNKIEFLIREEHLMLTSPVQWNTHIGVAYKVTI